MDLILSIDFGDIDDAWSDVSIGIPFTGPCLLFPPQTQNYTRLIRSGTIHGQHQIGSVNIFLA